jgi:hypothetical protein
MFHGKENFLSKQHRLLILLRHTIERCLMLPRSKFLPLIAGLFLSILPLLLVANEPGKWEITLIDSFPSDAPLDFKFVKATALDVDSEGSIYIIDRGKHQLLKFFPNGKPMRQIGGFGSGTQQFDDPRDVDAHTTLNVFVADYNNDRVMRYDRRLNFIGSLTSQWQEPFDFDRVMSIAVSSQYDLFLLEDGRKRVMKFSRFAEPKESFGGIYETYGQLLEPGRITIEDNKRLFVADPAQEAVIVFDYLGNYVSNLTHPDFKDPYSLYWGEDYQLYVVDRETATIFIFSEKLKFLGALSLSEVVNDIVDVAVKYDKESKKRRLYILEPNRCRIFALQNK